jgi:hypothetical protein
MMKVTDSQIAEARRGSAVAVREAVRGRTEPLDAFAERLFLLHVKTMNEFGVPLPMGVEWRSLSPRIRDEWRAEAQKSTHARRDR